MANQKSLPSTELLSPIKEIRDNIVFLKNGGFRKIVAVAGINFELQSEDEQRVALFGFQNFLNSLDFPTQIYIRSRKVSTANYIRNLDQQKEKETNETLQKQIDAYQEFIQSFVETNPIVEKSFFIVVPYERAIAAPFSKKQTRETTVDMTIPPEQLEILNIRTEQVISAVHQIGLRAVSLETDELKDLFYNLLNAEAISGEFAENAALTAKTITVSPNYLKINNRFSKTIFVLNYSRYLSTGWLSSLINMPETADISIHISPSDTATVMKQLTNKVAFLEADISSRESRGLVRDPELETALRDTEDLRDALQQSTEKLFSVGLYVAIYADTLQELNKLENRILALFESKLIEARPASFQQIAGMISIFPILQDRLNVTKLLNSSPLSSFFPFISVDLTSDKGILYGINRHNNTLVIFDRFSLENANMVVFAKAGAGKSYATKLEVIRSLMIGDEIIVIDPENEYENLAKSVGGAFIKISLDSQNHINPFDVPPIPKDENPDEILKSHIVNLTSLLKLMFGEIKPEEEAIIDQAVTEAYASKDITPDRDFSGSEPPLLENLEEIFRNIEGGRSLADRLYRFTKGSYAGFLNQASNIETKNRLTVFSIRDLEDELRPIAMFIILNFVWNLIRSNLKKRLMIIDEAWWMMKYPDSASFLFGLVKRARKYYLGISTITQDVEDFLTSPYGRPIITNSSLQLLLKQSPASIDITTKAFGLTEKETNYLLEVDIGQGLFLAGPKHAAIQIIPSVFEDEVITTNPEEILGQQKQNEENG